MLRKLLSATSQKKIALIESLLTHKQIYLNDLSKELDISMSALRKYILELTSDIPFLTITVDNYSSVQLTLDTYAALVDVYSHFLTHSTAFQLLELLFSSSFSSYDLLAVELNLSKSSLIRLIKKVNVTLQPFDFQISKKPIQLTGDEEAIRQFYLVFFLEKYQHEFMDASKNQEREFLQIAQIMAAATPLQLYFSDIRKIAFVIYIHMKRDKRLNLTNTVDNITYFGKKIDFADFVGYNENYIMMMVGYVTRYISSYPVDLETLKQEFLAITYQIFNRYDYSEPDFQSKLDAVVYYYLLSINLKVPYYILNDRITRFIENCDSVEKAINQEIAEILITSTLPVMRLDTIKYLTYLFHHMFPSFSRSVINRCTDFHLALYYDTTIHHVEFIKAKIKDYVPYSISISILNPLDTFSLSLKNESFDLIVGNIVPLSKIIPFKYTDVVITEKDILAIIQAIQQKGIRYFHADYDLL